MIMSKFFIRAQVALYSWYGIILSDESPYSTLYFWADKCNGLIRTGFNIELEVAELGMYKQWARTLRGAGLIQMKEQIRRTYCFIASKHDWLASRFLRISNFRLHTNSCKQFRITQPSNCSIGPKYILAISRQKERNSRNEAIMQRTSKQKREL